MNRIKNMRFLIARRMIQSGLLLVFAGGNYFGWKALMGNYSSAYVFGSFYLADPFAVIQILASGFMLNADVLLGALFVILFYGFIGGRGFCSWICPMNVVSDLALWLRKKTGFGKTGLAIQLNRRLRYWTMGLAVLLSVFFGFAAFEFISPVSMLYRGVIFGFGFGLAAVVAVFLFDLFVYKGGWCGHLCPIGAFYSVIGKFSLIRVNHKKEKCTDCSRCFGVCPEKQVLSIVNVRSGSILFGACTNCGRCIEACDDGALNFGVIKKNR